MAMIQLMLQLFMFLTYSLELQFVEPNDETVAERTKKKKKKKNWEKSWIKKKVSQ